MKKELYIASRIHRRERAFLNKLQKSQSEPGKSATSGAPNQDSLLQARGRGSVNPENSIVHLFHRNVDTYH
jgi:hypothetical protein